MNSDRQAGDVGNKHYKCYLGNRKVLTITHVLYLTSLRFNQPSEDSFSTTISTISTLEVPLKVRNDEWVGARPSMSSTVLL
jgi:hypothetical protein